MNRRALLPFLLSPVLAVTLGLVYLAVPPVQPVPEQQIATTAQMPSNRIVFLGGGLGEEELLTFTATLFASGHPGVLLLDSPKDDRYLKTFLEAFRPEEVIPVGTFSESVPALEKRLGVKTSPALAWKRGPPVALWKALFPKAPRAVLCPAEPRAQLLHAACLAGVLQAPLLVLRGDEGEAGEIERQLKEWNTRELYVIGDIKKSKIDIPDVKRVPLADADAVAKAYLQQQRKQGPIRNLVVANPADLAEGKGSLSTLAPWIALQRRAALLLTDDKGDNVEKLVRGALQNPDLREADALILVANPKAIPTKKRPNPAPGKDTEIEMEPFTPEGTEPFTFATGRLFHEDRGVVALMLARPALLAVERRALKALVVSNPGDSLPLLEVLSRHTAKELHNGGFQTKALFGDDVDKDAMRRLLPEQHIFLWEGHYKTLVEEYGFPKWDEPLLPSLIFMQSCLALNEAESQPLLRRGAFAVVGSATRNYSASGGAFSLAYFDALIYEDQTLGGSLRHAKNFLLCYAMLKDKRLGGEAKLNGANLRSAWAFSLWGDPTVKLPRPERPADALTPVRHEVKGDTITVTLPDTSYDKVTSGRFQAQMRPNGRLAGLLHKEGDASILVPFVFAEVRLPKAPPGKKPVLTTSLPERNWVFCWDARRQCGYLLIAPREKDRKEVRFRVKWED